MYSTETQPPSNKPTMPAIDQQTATEGTENIYKKPKKNSRN